ncbi:hypothetical protein CPB86DRAFT_70044 [Serendipita vermifera]|nr:hypothetical protein CPB86DRAFT_70044 [Serendipita vermifera]
MCAGLNFGGFNVSGVLVMGDWPQMYVRVLLAFGYSISRQSELDELWLGDQDRSRQAWPSPIPLEYCRSRPSSVRLVNTAVERHLTASTQSPNTLNDWLYTIPWIIGPFLPDTEVFPCKPSTRHYTRWNVDVSTQLNEPMYKRNSAFVVELCSNRNK